MKFDVILVFVFSLDVLDETVPPATRGDKDVALGRAYPVFKTVLTLTVSATGFLPRSLVLSEVQL